MVFPTFIIESSAAGDNSLATPPCHSLNNSNTAIIEDKNVHVSSGLVQNLINLGWCEKDLENFTCFQHHRGCI